MENDKYSSRVLAQVSVVGTDATMLENLAELLIENNYGRACDTVSVKDGVKKT